MIFTAKNTMLTKTLPNEIETHCLPYWHFHTGVQVLLQHTKEPRLDGFDKDQETVLGAVLLYHDYCQAIGFTVDYRIVTLSQWQPDQIEEARAEVVQYLTMNGRL